PRRRVVDEPFAHRDDRRGLRPEERGDQRRDPDRGAGGNHAHHAAGDHARRVVVRGRLIQIGAEAVPARLIGSGEHRAGRPLVRIPLVALMPLVILIAGRGAVLGLPVLGLPVLGLPVLTRSVLALLVLPLPVPRLLPVRLLRVLRLLPVLGLPVLGLAVLGRGVPVLWPGVTGERIGVALLGRVAVVARIVLRPRVSLGAVERVAVARLLLVTLDRPRRAADARWRPIGGRQRAVARVAERVVTH